MVFIACVCVGIIAGILIERYLFHLLDLKLEVQQYKETRNATAYQLKTQELLALFNRKYPEVNNIEQQELTPAIGFHYTSSDEEEYFD